MDKGNPKNRLTSHPAAILGAAIWAMSGTGALREAPTQAPTQALERLVSLVQPKWPNPAAVLLAAG